jgi:hypothetical protein
MWKTDIERLALLELLVCGTLKKKAGQIEAFQALSELPWTRATGRKLEIRLVEDRRSDLEALLGRVWPEWQVEFAELTTHELPPTPEGWNRLLDMRRVALLPQLPERVNRRTAAALAAPHSKAALTHERRLALGNVHATHDGLVRLRPPSGFFARTKCGILDLSAIAAALGEVGIPERAFLDGLQFEGDLQAVLLVENLGAWRDLPAPSGWLLVHVPGWNTTTSELLLERLAPNVPVVHFGDLDPNGMRIYLHLRERRPSLIWFVPDFWSEYIDNHGRPTQWPMDLDTSSAPRLVRTLTARGLWLEQECVVLDARTEKSLMAIETEFGRRA